MSTADTTKTIKPVDNVNGNGVNLFQVERLLKRYQSAAGQQNSVIGEVFGLLNKTVKNQERYERRLAVLESK